MYEYKSWVREHLEAQEGLHIKQGMVEGFLIEGGTGVRRIGGIFTQAGEEFQSNAVVVASGTFLNGLIPSEQRATVLSFDSLMGSIGGTIAQPALGRVADVSGYAASYLVSGTVTALALPFIFLARREKAPSDPIDQSETIAA